MPGGGLPPSVPSPPEPAGGDLSAFSPLSPSCGGPGRGTPLLSWLPGRHRFRPLLAGAEGNLPSSEPSPPPTGAEAEGHKWRHHHPSPGRLGRGGQRLPGRAKAGPPPRPGPPDLLPKGGSLFEAAGFWAYLRQGGRPKTLGGAFALTPLLA